MTNKNTTKAILKYEELERAAPPCPVCGKKVVFNKHKGKYNTFCSENCRKSEAGYAFRLKRTEETCLNKFGVTNAFASEEIKDKIYATNIKKYGVKIPTQNQEIKEKAKKTCIDRYGVENPVFNKDVVQKIKEAARLKRVHYWDKYLTILKEKGISPLFKKEEYCGGEINSLLNFGCIVCGEVFQAPLGTPHPIYCPNGHTRSNEELEVYSYVKDLLPSNRVYTNYPFS